MKTANDKDDTTDQPLLDDDAFAALMQAEYARQKNGDDADTLRRERIWRRIQARVAIRRWRAWLPAAAAALLVLALAPLLQRPEEDVDLRAKGEIATGMVVFLLVQVLGDDGQPRAYQPPLHAGDTLLFSSKVSRAGSVALAMAGADGVPGVRFSAVNQRPGIWQLLQHDGNAYGYRLEAQDESLRICLIGAPSAGELQQRTAALADIWPYLPPSSCALIESGDR